MNIVLVRMTSSAFNRSIWEGLLRGFEAEQHRVLVFRDQDLPSPSSLPFRPDLLLAIHGGTVRTDKVVRYRNEGVKTAVYLLDEPYEVDRSTEWAAHYDWVFTVDRMTVDAHREHSHAEFLPLAYDSARFRQDGKLYRSRVLILGSPFEHRLLFLTPLRTRFGKHVTWVGPGWRRFCPAGVHVETLVTPEICARFYRGSDIVINIHRDSLWSHWGEMNRRRIPATHLNPRFWEASACGSFQLSSYRADLDPFAPELRSFGTPEELAERLEEVWDRGEERRFIAERTRQGLLTHSYRHRAQSVISSIFSERSLSAKRVAVGC